MATKCPYCTKEYSRKSSFDKHILICDFLQKSKKEQEIDNQESDNLPSFKELVIIVQELAKKNKKLEEKMTHMEKWIETKKKKVNVVQWLNQNVIPPIHFLDWCTRINVSTNHMMHLFESPIHETVIKIIQDDIEESAKTLQNILPIHAFDQKANTFYIYNGTEWTLMTNHNFSTILIKIQQRFLKEMEKWRTQNMEQMDNNDKTGDTYNKTIMKLMNINTTQDGTFNKIKTFVYNTIKVDIKNMIEYEFEF